MKTLLFLFLILPLSGAMGQKNMIGIFISPNSSFRNVSAGKDYEKNISERTALFDYGFSFKRTFKKNFSINTGLNISNKGFDFKSLYDYNNHIFYKTHHVLTYLEIPVGSAYSFVTKKNFRVNVGADFINQFLLQVSYKPYDVQKIPEYLGPSGQAEDWTLSHSELKQGGYRMYNYGIGFSTEVQIKMISNLWGESITDIQILVKSDKH